MTPSKCTRTLKGHVGPVHVVRFDSKRVEYFIINYCNFKLFRKRRILYEWRTGQENLLVERF